MVYRLVLCDIEGTITCPGGRGISDGLNPAVRELRLIGVSVGLVTGRDTAYAEVVHNLLNMNGPIIAENGSLVSYFEGMEKRIIEVGKIEDSVKESIRDILKRNGIYDRMVEDERKMEMMTFYPIGFPVSFSEEDVKKLYEQICPLLSAYKNQIDIMRSGEAVDILKKDINKGEGVRIYCERVNVPLKEVACVIDSLNDLPAAETIGKAKGLVCLVASASEDLKRKLKPNWNIYFSKSPAPDGGAECLEFIAGCNRKSNK